MDKYSMISFIVAHASGNANETDIRRYFDAQTEDLVRESYQKLLQGEMLRITNPDAATQAAKVEAAAAQARTAQEYANWIWATICNTPIQHISAKFNNKVCDSSTANRIEVFS